MPKIKITLDGTRGIVQELIRERNSPSELIENLEKTVYATKNYVDSLVLGSGSGGSSSLSGSNVFGSSTSDIHQFTGAIIANNGLTGSLLGTSSFSLFASNSLNADKINGLDSDSLAKINQTNTFNSNQIINGDLTINGTASVNVLITTYESSSVIFTSGSTIFGNSSDDFHQFTGSVLLNNGITGSLLGTASYAINALSVNGLNVSNIATTSSNTFIGNQIISGSLDISGSSNFHNSSFIITGSYYLTGSQFITGACFIKGNIDVASGSSFYYSGNRLFNYASFSSTQQQTASLNTATQMTFNVVDIAENINLISGSRLQVIHGGVYNLQFSAQFDKVGGGSGTSKVSIWFRKDGQDIPNSCTDITITGTPANAAVVPSWNYITQLTSSQYIEIMWSTNDTNINIVKSGARTTPIRPAMPSIIATLTQIA
jgi:hypothetical protein